MPIDFGPPSAQVQPYQITPVQYTDPLETLARMQQLRTQNLQQQNAQLQLQQAQMKMDSQKGVIRWLADQPSAGATQETQPAVPAEPSPAPAATPQPQPFVIPSAPATVPQAPPLTAQTPPPSAPATVPQAPPSDTSFLGRMARDASKYGILPDDWFAIQNHYLTYKKETAALTEAQQKIYSDNADAFAGAYRQLAQKKDSDQGDLNAVNNGLIARGVPREWLMTTYPVGHGDMTPQMLIQAHGNTQLKLKEIQDAEKEEAQLAQTRAGTTKTGIETEDLLKADLAKDVRLLPVDPKTGTPTPDTWITLRKNPKYKDLNLPETPTQDYISGLEEYTIPQEKLPAYRIEQVKAQAIQAYAKMTPQELDAQVDQIMPATDPMSAPTKALVARNAKLGNYAKVDEILKDAYDQKGREQVAKVNAQNRMNITLSGYGQQLTGGIGGGPGGPNADLHGEEYLKTLPPALAAQVKNIATGGDVLPARMTGPAILLRNAVYQYDPAYTPLLAQQRRETLKEFTNTNIQHAGGQALALNTLIHHADLYLQTAEALKNKSFRPGNAVYNAVASTFGSAPPTQADLVARFFAGETGKVATGGVPGEGEVNGILKNLSNANSPDQIAGAGKTLLGIAAGRMVPLKERAAEAKLEGIAPAVLGPSAREILTRRGFDPETMQPAQAGGGRGGGANIPRIPDSIPQQYRSSAHYSPSQNAFYYSTDGGKTYLKVQAQ